MTAARPFLERISADATYPPARVTAAIGRGGDGGKVSKGFAAHGSRPRNSGRGYLVRKLSELGLSRRESVRIVNAELDEAGVRELDPPDAGRGAAAGRFLAASHVSTLRASPGEAINSGWLGPPAGRPWPALLITGYAHLW